MGARRLAAVAVAVALTATACGDSGLEAPALAAPERICGEGFCVEHPGDWEVVEATDEFVSLHHPLSPERVLATVGQVNMEGVVVAAGREWPQIPDTVIRSFWEIIDDGNATLRLVKPRTDGSLTSEGSFRDGNMWYGLFPTEGRMAIGVEVRAPNDSWAPHATAIIDSLAVLP